MTGKLIHKGALAVAALALAWSGSASAQIAVNPNGLNISTSGPTTALIRFANNIDTDQFTTTVSQFCTALLANGACNPATILGVLPSGFDRGSTRIPTTRVTDFMTIPGSVVRRAVVRAQQGAFSDFFYVRTFSPVGGADLGNGAGVDVFASVTCRMTAGIARSPLSLTRVVLYGNEPDNDRNDLIRIDDGNIDTGVVKADIRLTGTGLITGWWEVRTPGDPPVREIDRFTEASLSENLRATQQRFRRVKRFRVQAPVSGRLTLTGPRYEQLPIETPGVYEVLLRVEVSKDRESLSVVAGDPGSQRLFSGAAAGFPLETLEYRVVAALTGGGEAVTPLNPRVVVEKIPDSNEIQVTVVWAPIEDMGKVMRIDVINPTTGAVNKVIVPMKNGSVALPRSWTRGQAINDLQYTVTPLGANRLPLAEAQQAKAAQ